MKVIKIDESKCTKCKKCYDLCPQDVLAMDENTGYPYSKYPGECWFCGICWMECPKRAIDIRLPASLH